MHFLCLSVFELGAHKGQTDRRARSVMRLQ